MPTLLAVAAVLFCSVGDTAADDQRDPTRVEDFELGLAAATAEPPFSEKFRMILILREKNFFQAVETFQNLIVLFCKLLLLITL